MKVYTYSQYIKCIHTLRLNAVLQLAEESTEYNLKKAEKKYSHDKLIRDILQDKKEATEFINQFVKPRQKVKEEELVRYTNSYMSKKYKSKEVNLIYKLENQDIFFLIEHQSNINNTISYRMLNYCLDIMQEWSKNRKIKRTENYPIIVPIIIYTGSQKWKVAKNLKEKQISNYVFEKYQIDMEYNLVDINKIAKQTLWEKNTMFGYVMSIQKVENKEELMQDLNDIIKLVEEKEKLEELAKMITYLLNDVLEDKIQQKILEKIKRKIRQKHISSISNQLNKSETQSNRDIQREKEAS